VKEFWDADKLRELDLDLLTPMFARGHRHFYVNELAETNNGDLVIPLRWITINGVVYGESIMVKNIGSKVSDIHYIFYSTYPSQYSGFSNIRCS
jgi:hypothetical protein